MMGNFGKALICQLFLWVIISSATIPPETTDSTYINKVEDEEYIAKYGYLARTPNPLYEFDAETSKKVQMWDSIRSFQKRMRLPLTGVIDKATDEEMRKRRCGVPNLPEEELLSSDNSLVRKRRYSLISMWPYLELTYKIGVPTKKLSQDILEKEVDRAFKAWELESGLRFDRVPADEEADINVGFFKTDHGDDLAFDGEGKVLAHAQFPTEGIIHLDDDEDWTSETMDGTNLFQVLVHELGHALGLEHSGNKNSTMFEIYRGWQPHFKLDRDDVEGIQALYGAPKKQIVDSPSHGNDHGNALDPCKVTSWDAHVVTKDKTEYLFKDDYYFKLNRKNAKLSRTPRRTSDDFETLNGKIDAAATLPSGHTVFFQGRNVRIFINQYPVDYLFHTIASMFGSDFPANVDSAWVWNKILYVSKGSEYWRFGSQQRKYPRPLSKGWSFAPNKPETADNGGRLVTFTSKGDIIRMGKRKDKTAWAFFKCRNNLKRFSLLVEKSNQDEPITPINESPITDDPEEQFITDKLDQGMLKVLEDLMEKRSQFAELHISSGSTALTCSLIMFLFATVFTF